MASGSVIRFPASSAISPLPVIRISLYRLRGLLWNTAFHRGHAVPVRIRAFGLCGRSPEAGRVRKSHLGLRQVD